MPWLFSLSAECGISHIVASTFAKYFDNLHSLILDENGIAIKTFVFQEDKTSNWWCIVGLPEIEADTDENPTTVNLITQVSHLLYEHLKFASNFRYALVGFEVDEFRTFDELITDDLIRNHPSCFNGLVISEEIWNEMGCPDSFVFFKEAYLWLPYSEKTNSE